MTRFTRKQLDGFRAALANHGTWDYEPGYYTLTEDGEIKEGGGRVNPDGLHVSLTGNREYDIDTCLDYIGCFTPADAD